MKIIKTTVSLLIVLSCITTHAQAFKKKHIRKLENLDIPFKMEYSQREQATKDLHQILHFDFKRRAKNTFGSSLMTIGIGGLVGGALLINAKNYHGKTSGLYTILGGTCFLVGAAGVGTSIPLFIGARKSRKERDKLKLLYESETMKNTSAF